ncbi:hypothetical protein MKW92_025099 [Papaver armeniacum]|nr:hypothetical protein MKW92_025099 [Papaver armeniacum]
MARRSHLTDLGCIACEDLTELGAGKEGWLVNDPTLLSALDTHCLALSNQSLILILDWNNQDSNDPSSINKLKIRPSLIPSLQGEITAIQWLVFDDIKVLAIGTSNGYLLIYSLRGDLVHEQMIYPGRILRLRVRATKSLLSEDASSEELCVVMPGVIARFDGSDLWKMLQKWSQDTHSQMWEQTTQNREDLGNSYGRIAHQLWNVSKYGSCADASITGLMPPPLMEVQSSERFYCAVTIGEDTVVPVAFSTISSFSSMIWSNKKASPKKSEVKPQSFARASVLTCLKDHPRKGEKLTLSPSGSLAAITDSLGRILLLDTQALVVVRIWKGYRDACCLFMEMQVGKDKASSSSAYHEYSKSDYCLCLAIHAPRKGIIEVWQMRIGPRLFSIQCAKGSKILQPTPRFISSSSYSSLYFPLEVFLLNGDSGRLSVLNRSLN